MTKLMEWLAVFGALFAVWVTLVTNKIESSFVRQNPTLVLYSPLIFLVLFGLYAASIVLYRVLTFNNCEEASVELQNEIQEAKADLAKLGFKFHKEVK